jgi:membrane-bound ClpP family serine protease
MITVFALTGLLLIFLEFFLPGTIMAIGGMLMLSGSLILFYFQAEKMEHFAFFVIVLLAGLLGTIYLGIRRIKKGKVLHTADQEGFKACDFPKEMIGLSALVSSDLKPCGYIEVDGNAFAALSKLGYIEKGKCVRIIGGQGTHLIVTEEKNHDVDK